jgi:class 3 adenylate cyclase
MLTQGGPWDLLIADLALAGDADTLGIVLVGEAKYRSIPTVVVSVHLTVQMTRQLFRMGADDVFEKFGLDEVEFRGVAHKLVRRGRPALPAESAEGTVAGRRALRQLFPGSSRHVMAVLFTDVVGSTHLNNLLGDEAMSKIRQAHFRQGDRFLKATGGRRIKTIGDSIMAVFPTPSDALDFASKFQADPGNKNIKIRVGFHVGPVEIEGGDTFGSTVNFTARVASNVQGPGICASNDAHRQIQLHKAGRHSSIRWCRRPGVMLKGFKGRHVLWSVEDSECQNLDPHVV